MKRSLKISFVAIASVSVLFAAGCNHSSSSTTELGTFKIGTILPETGDISFLGPPMIEAVNLAASEINAADVGIKVEISSGDSGTDPAVAGAQADEHIANKVHGIIGAAASGISLSIIDKITSQNIVMISPSNTSPTFTDYEDGGYYFRTAPTDILQGSLLADLIIEDGNDSVAIINRADDYGRQLAQATKTSLEAGGASGTIIEYDPKAPTYSSEAQKVKSGSYNAIVLIAFEEGVKVLSSLIEANVGPKNIDTYTTDGIAVGDLGERVSPSDQSVIAGITGIAPSSSPQSGESTFPARFKAFAPQVTDLIFSSAAFDALIVLGLAALEAKSTDPTVYSAKINGVTRDGVKCNLFARCAELIQDGKNIDYDGASGPLEFSDAGEPSAGVYDVYKYGSDGARSKVAERTLTG